MRFSPEKKLKDVLRLADFRSFWAETGYSLPLATLFSNFSTAKKLHSKERKQKPFAAQTPPRKRGYGRISHTEIICTSVFSKNLISHCPQSRAAKSPRDKRADMGFCTKLNIFGTSVIFNILKQSTGLIFLPSSLTRDDFYKCYFYV